MFVLDSTTKRSLRLLVHMPLGAATLTGKFALTDYCLYAIIKRIACSCSSGFEGPWTFSPITFTNDFYTLLLSEKYASQLFSYGVKLLTTHLPHHKVGLAQVEWPEAAPGQEDPIAHDAAYGLCHGAGQELQEVCGAVR